MLISLFQKFDNILVIDIETTGLNPKLDEIIEIGILRIVSDNGHIRISDTFGTLIKLSSPDRELPDKITELTGITNQQLNSEGVLKDEACLKLVDFLCNPNSLLAAYNAQFDLNFLFYFLNSFKKADLLKKIKMLDVLTVYRDRKQYPHRLRDAVSAYSINSGDAHRALYDAQMTFEVLCEMAKEYDDLVQYVNLFGYISKHGVYGQRISSIRYTPQEYNRIKKLYEL